MTTRFARPRAGFTLIEMLIVIGIIATLAAISVGAFFQVRGSQDKSVTEVTLNKLHSTFDGKYKAVLDEAKKTVPPLLVDALGGDKDRALAAWTIAKIKNEFPQTKTEASTPYNLPGGNLAARKVFSTVAAGLQDPVGDPEQISFTQAKNSSALAYAALTATGTGGTMGGTEGLQQQTKTEGEVTYFVDAWNMPIGFKRNAYNTEIQPPVPKNGLAQQNAYFRPNTINSSGRPFYVNNPLDPRGKIIDINPMDPSEPNDAFRVYLAPKLGVDLSVQPNDFSNANQLATFYSAGPNKEFGADPLDLTVEEALDNLFSYRLRREGAKGD